MVCSQFLCIPQCISQCLCILHGVLSQCLCILQGVLISVCVYYRVCCLSVCVYYRMCLSVFVYTTGCVVSVFVYTTECAVSVFVYSTCCVVSVFMLTTRCAVTVFVRTTECVVSVFVFCYFKCEVRVIGKCNKDLKIAQIPGGGKIFRNRPDSSWDPSRPLYNWYRIMLPGSSGRGVALTTHPHLATTLKRSRATPVFMSRYRVNFTVQYPRHIAHISLNSIPFSCSPVISLSQSKHNDIPSRASGGAVGWCTALQGGRSRVRLPMT